jgi:hypothetical protein
MSAIRFALLGALLLSSNLHAAGLVSTANFIVLTPAIPTQEVGQKYAQEVLNRAEGLRDEIANEWLGEQLPEGAGRTIISVHFSNSEDSALTWAKDDPSRKFHNIYLTTSPESAMRGRLRHEMVHAVLATKAPHPNRLSPWVEEGIASRYDDDWLISLRKQTVLNWIRMGSTPSLEFVLETENIQSFDDDGYAAAESLVGYLLTRGDKRTLIPFAEMGQQTGWDIALQAHYGITSVNQLQAEWEEWLMGQLDT